MLAPDCEGRGGSFDEVEESGENEVTASVAGLYFRFRAVGWAPNVLKPIAAAMSRSLPDAESRSVFGRSAGEGSILPVACGFV